MELELFPFRSDHDSNNNHFHCQTLNCCLTMMVIQQTCYNWKKRNEKSKSSKVVRKPMNYDCVTYISVHLLNCYCIFMAEKKNEVKNRKWYWCKTINDIVHWISDCCKFQIEQLQLHLEHAMHVKKKRKV